MQPLSFPKKSATAAWLVPLLALALLLGPAAMPSHAQNCPNAEVRQQQGSAYLPDCRAYELVSPPNMGARFPGGRAAAGGMGYFNFLKPVRPDGGSVLFEVLGGVMPGFPGTGFDDRYRSVRTGSGWETRLISPTPAESEIPGSGGVSPDHEFSFVATRFQDMPDEGSLNARAGVGVNDQSTWVRYPDGAYELIGRGNLTSDARATGQFISPGGGHIVFSSLVQLEPEAPLAGTLTVYDRTADGVTHVVSLLPGDVTPVAQEARYLGASADGSAIAFAIEEDMYVRLDNQTTKPVAGGAPIFAGVSADGGRLFYESTSENIFVYDTATGATTTVTSNEDSKLVNVSADGSHVYFVSESQLDGSKGTAGAGNLYVWDVATETVRFIATVDLLDVSGQPNLVSWTSDVVAPGQGPITGPGNSTARTNPSGTVLVFASRAQLTGYENQGFAQIYRYDVDDGSLTCVSCNPSNAPPTSDAVLQVYSNFNPGVPLDAASYVVNLTDDGGAVFFETGDALVPRDSNGAYDVYQWRGGGVSLISSGAGTGDSYLYGATPDGQDVVFATTEDLTATKITSGSGAIYDARVNGGFLEPTPPVPCLGEACRALPTVPPSLPNAATPTLIGKGNIKPSDKSKHGKKHRRCRKAQRRGKRCSRKTPSGGRSGRQAHLVGGPTR